MKRGPRVPTESAIVRARATTRNVRRKVDGRFSGERSEIPGKLHGGRAAQMVRGGAGGEFRLELSGSPRREFSERKPEFGKQNISAVKGSR